MSNKKQNVQILKARNRFLLIIIWHSAKGLNFHNLRVTFDRCWYTFCITDNMIKIRIQIAVIVVAPPNPTTHLHGHSFESLSAFMK